MVVVAGVSEASGVLFAAGLLTPFAALLMTSTMVVAVGSVHIKNGLFSTNGGYEYVGGALVLATRKPATPEAPAAAEESETAAAA